MTNVSREEFEALIFEVKALRARVAELESARGIDEETMTVLSAAIAAYLGKRATLRFVRRVDPEDTSWRALGRASVSASRSLPKTKAW